MPVKICHIITSLEVGGAQMLLLDVCRGLSVGKAKHFVIAISRNLILKSNFESIGCHVYCLSIESAWDFPLGLVRLVRVLNRERPKIIQTWLYHADFISIFTSFIFKKAKIIWSIHHASASKLHMRYSTWFLIRILSLASYIFPARILYCSVFAEKIHHSIGYCKWKSLVIENGIDTNKFCPQNLVRSDFKSSLSIPKDAIVIGMIARFSSIKGFDIFFKMASLLKQKIPNIYFILAGTDVCIENAYLVSTLKSAGIENSVYLLGERSDISFVINGCDVLVCPSYTESFGLVALEGLACGVPVVCSDIEAFRAFNFGCLIAAVGDPVSFYEAVLSIIGMSVFDKEKMSHNSRATVINQFSLEKMLLNYQALYSELAEQD